MLHDHGPFYILLKCLICLRLKIPKCIKLYIAEISSIKPEKNRELNLDIATGDYNEQKLSLKYIPDKTIQRVCSSPFILQFYFTCRLGLTGPINNRKLNIYNALPEYIKEIIVATSEKKEMLNKKREIHKHLREYNSIANFMQHSDYCKDYFQKQLSEYHNYLIQNRINPEAIKCNTIDKHLYDMFFTKYYAEFDTNQFGITGFNVLQIKKKLFKQHVPDPRLNFIRAVFLSKSKERKISESKYFKFYDKIKDLLQEMEI